MEEDFHKNNLRTLFGIENIPQNSQLGGIIDAIPSEALAPVFKDYAIFPNTLLCVIDGTQYWEIRLRKAMPLNAL